MLKFLIPLLVVAGLYFLCHAFVVKVRVPDDYVGWVLLVPVKHREATSYDEKCACYVVDHRGIALVDSSVARGNFWPRLLRNGENVSSSTKYTGLATRFGLQGKSNYTFVQFYIPQPALWNIPDIDNYWMRESFALEKKKDILLDSLLARKGVLIDTWSK